MDSTNASVAVTKRREQAPDRVMPRPGALTRAYLRKANAGVPRQSR